VPKLLFLDDKKIDMKNIALVNWDNGSFIIVFVFGFVVIAIIATVLLLMNNDKKKK
jgi:ABC-type multidrug transport system permease subunit